MCEVYQRVVYYFQVRIRGWLEEQWEADTTLPFPRLWGRHPQVQNDPEPQLAPKCDPSRPCNGRPPSQSGGAPPSQSGGGGTRPRQDQLYNPTRDSRFSDPSNPISARITKNTMRSVISAMKTKGKPPIKRPDGQERCHSWHIRGNCFTGCKHLYDHSPITSGEQDRLWDPTRQHPFPNPIPYASIPTSSPQRLPIPIPCASIPIPCASLPSSTRRLHCASIPIPCASTPSSTRRLHLRHNPTPPSHRDLGKPHPRPASLRAGSSTRLRAASSSPTTRTQPALQRAGSSTPLPTQLRAASSSPPTPIPQRRSGTPKLGPSPTLGRPSPIRGPPPTCPPPSYPIDRLDVHITKAIHAYNNSTTSWGDFIRTIRGSGDLHPHVGAIPHPAGHLLAHFGQEGTPASMNDPPWTTARIAGALARGPHQSSRQGIDFLREEYADMMDKQQWTTFHTSG
eukprot:jgi/Psemu1/46352/gm1.46352_g